MRRKSHSPRANRRDPLPGLAQPKAPVTSCYSSRDARTVVAQCRKRDHKGCHMADERDLAAGADELEKLAAELDGQIYAVSLVTGEGKRPHLHVVNRRAPIVSEYIYSDGEHFYWGWAQPIAAIANLAAAAAAIDRVLSPLSGSQ